MHGKEIVKHTSVNTLSSGITTSTLGETVSKFINKLCDNTCNTLEHVHKTYIHMYLDLVSCKRI